MIFLAVLHRPNNAAGGVDGRSAVLVVDCTEFSRRSGKSIRPNHLLIHASHMLIHASHMVVQDMLASGLQLIEVGLAFGLPLIKVSLELGSHGSHGDVWGGKKIGEKLGKVESGSDTRC